MNAAVFRVLLSATLFIAAAFASLAARGQSCECTHQGAGVSCPAGLPPGSHSVQFVSGGTQWVTPSGQTVFVPQTSFACNGPTTPQTVPSSTKPSTSAPNSSHTDRDSGNRRHDALIGAGAAVLIDQMHRKDDKHRRAEGSPPEQACDSPSCASQLREDPAMACYRHVSATVNDGHGMPHTGTLYDQLRDASGIGNASLAPTCTQGICEAPAYDCGGTFYDGNGEAVHVPPFSPATIRTDEDLKRWKESVSNFYRMSFLDPHRGSRLSPGKADVCSLWAELRSQSEPDPSVLQALDTLQQVGAESTRPDVPWIDNIQSAGTSDGCGALPLPSGHDMDSFVVPEESARSFLRGFRDCSQNDANRVGGCPHAFDPANHVNVQYLLSADTSQHVPASIFIGDPTGGCGMSCYRNEGATNGRTLRDALPHMQGSNHSDADCDAAVGACIDACQADNAALSRQCIDMGGIVTPGICTANVERCSCTQTSPDCRRK